MGLGGGEGQRVNPDWVTGTDPFISVWCVLRVDDMAPKFTVEKSGGVRLAAVSGIGITQYTRKERRRAQPRAWGSTTAAERPRRRQFRSHSGK